MLFSIGQHSRQEECEKRLSKALNFLDQKFQRTTSELYLSFVDQHLRELNSIMKPFGTSLAQLVSEGIQEGMKVSTGELLLAINALKQEKKEGQESSLKGILDEFKKTLSSSTQNEFRDLQTTIASLSSTLSQSASQSSNFASDLSEVVKSLKDSAQIQKTSVGESVNVLTSQVTSLVSQLSDSTSRQMDVIQTIATNLAMSSTESMKSQKEAVNQSIEKLTSQVEALISNLSEAGLKQAQSLEGVTTSIVTRSKEANLDLVSAVEKAVSKQQTVAKEFVEANLAIRTSLNDLQGGAQAIKQILSFSENAAKTILNQVDQNSRTALAVSGAVQQSNELFAKAQRQQEQAASEMQRYQQLFKEAEQSCNRVLTTLDQNLRQYSNVTSEHLSNVLKQYDQQLSNASQVFTATVRDLEETLSEALAKKSEIEQRKVA
ncbi:hypothetical protein EBR03_06430 [bacterium]|nr:hypothetical protein [bacterium]